MTEQTSGQALEHDHHVIDEQFAAFARSLDGVSPDRAALDQASLGAGIRAIKHHIYVEEEFHFPPLRAGSLMGPLMVMLREHGELWDLLDRLEALVAMEAPVVEISHIWQQAAALLKAHNEKEEQIVYPSGDQILDPETSATVRAELASGQTPDGWTAQMAGRN